MDVSNEQFLLSKRTYSVEIKGNFPLSEKALLLVLSRPIILALHTSRAEI